MNAPLRNVTLEDKYALSRGRVFLTGTQALVRLLLLQHQRDALAGLNTAGYVSGYRGSPVGGLDQALWKAKSHLQQNQIVFQPGVNEDLAATALWGTQQVNLSPGARHDGVFGMWYGKGPGVDRCGDVFKHANSAGTAKHGGVLVVAGDDHAARSSTVAHQSEHAFKAAMIPVLVPAGVQDYLDLGLHGWAMSRYSGCWVGFKAVADTIESSASADVSPDRVQIVLPTDYVLPAEGLNIRWPDDRVSQEARLLDHKLYAALAYCRANRLNQIVIDSPKARLGIITTGKSYLDVRQAFDDLGIDDALAAEIGIRLYKIGMVWPLESDGVRRFAEGLEEILVVEEKRQLIEYQLKEELYNWREDVRPRVIGKFDEKGEWALPHGRWLLPAAGDLAPAQIARVIADRISKLSGHHFSSPRIRDRLAVIDAKERSAAPMIPIARIPYFCPGCPHNTSTRVPEGSRALAGIGCHYMVLWMNRDTTTFSHMGGEGAAWMGQAPFTEQRHVFANLGDGTYFHSGVLAVRAAVAAFNGPIPLATGGGGGGSPGSQAEQKGLTFKILYNDAVAMTGGQPVDGSLTVPQIAAQLRAEGVHHIVVVTDGTGYANSRPWGHADLPHGVSIRHRDELDAIQREMRECPGVSAIIYDQTCAAEKRRRRKRGRMIDPPRRLFINEAVCEGCGDCGAQSNCLALVPVETEFGRKRAIDQSACNKDYSCEKGFCPSFVSVLGGGVRKGRELANATGASDAFGVPPAPTLALTAAPYGMLITGVGGTGVVTIGALIGMAAHIDGKGVTVLDMTGLAQKGGAVLCHVRICDDPATIHAVRIATGEADAVIGGDVIVTASPDALTRMQAGRTRVVVNSAETPTADFTSNPDWQFPLARMQAVVNETVGAGAAHFVDASDLALRLLGDSIASNLFLLGYAWQLGMVPVSAEAIDRAIELNATAVPMSRAAFLWGRRAAHDPAAVAAHARPNANAAPSQGLQPGMSIDELIARRVRFLTEYQDAAYAARYRTQVEKVRAAEAAINSSQLAEAVAHNLFKLMAIKDEYEVARLYAEADFLQRLGERFEGDYTLRFHLAPPLLAGPDPNSGIVKKIAFGPWMLSAFKWLAKARGLRGSRWDIFGRSDERRLERALLADYEADLAALLPKLQRTTLGDAIALASLPQKIRGFGHVKRRNIDATLPERKTLRDRLGLV